MQVSEYDVALTIKLKKIFENVYVYLYTYDNVLLMKQNSV